MMKKLLISMFVFSVMGFADDYIDLSDAGFIPVWLTAGPFDQALVGFGLAGDKNLIDECNINPYQGKKEKSSLVENGELSWQVQSIQRNGFIDFNNLIGHWMPGKSPEKLWYATESFASSTVFCEQEQDVQFLVGSNSRMKIWLNGNSIYKSAQERGALADQDSISVKFQKGKNHILVRVGNSQNNLIVDWFGGTPWGWGFFLRIVDSAQKVPSGVKLVSPLKINKISCDLKSTFFFKKDKNRLMQKIDVTFFSPETKSMTARLHLRIEDNKFDFEFNDVRCGDNRREIYIPELMEDRKAKYIFSLGDQKVEKLKVLKKQKHYKLYLTMTSHMDIGYTNTQPIVKERHIQTMLEVLQKCRDDSDFRWMVESLWVFEVFKSGVSQEIFNDFMNYVKNGQIDISPIYTNPFTGWIGVEEMIRSFDLAANYHSCYNIDFPAAMYNDSPGVSWIMPQMLEMIGTGFLACGINEIYRENKLQRELPKVFFWEGADESRVLTYITNAYTEGRYVGLEKNPMAVEQMLWTKLNHMEATNYPYELVLLNSAFSDNAGIPNDQYETIKKWNKQYEYPRIQAATLGEFAKDFSERYKSGLPVIKGDWTSNWDIFYQSEPKEFIGVRSIQHQLLSVEKLSTINWLLNPDIRFPGKDLDEAYQMLLHFSGHGSGLEAGFGTPEDNVSTMAFRKGYIDQANLISDELWQRSLYRFYTPHTSFESEGILLFNSLSWERNAEVEIPFKTDRKLTFNIIDLVTGENVPYFSKNNKIRFIARDLPSLGYKKYKIAPNPNKNQFVKKDLILTDKSIENLFFRIVFNADADKVTQIIDKRTNQNLIGKTDHYSFAQPIVKHGMQNEGFKTINQDKPQFNIIDERPVRLILQLKYDQELFESTEYILWSDIEKIGITQVLNLDMLTPTDIIEEYGLAFPFEMKKSDANLEIIGGFLKPQSQRLPGIDHNAFSIRRSVALSNKSSSFIWTTKDRRVIRLEHDNKRPVIISDIVNNFPEAWNRNQDNSGKIKLEYCITSFQESFNPGRSCRFGWEFSTPVMAYKNWFKTLPATEEYFKIDNDQVIVLDMKVDKSNDFWIMEIMNTNPDKIQEVTISSKFFQGQKIQAVDFLGNIRKSFKTEAEKIQLKIKANQIIRLCIRDQLRQMKN